MHPVHHHLVDKSQRGGHAVSWGANLRRWLRMAFDGWKRHRMLSALRAVNDHWLKRAEIDRNDIEGLVDRVVQREIPVLATAPLARQNHNKWQTAA